MGELSMRGVGLAPLGLEREDLLDLGGHQPVHRGTAARPVGEPASAPPRSPPAGPAL